MNRNFDDDDDDEDDVFQLRKGSTQMEKKLKSKTDMDDVSDTDTVI